MRGFITLPLIVILIIAGSIGAWYAVSKSNRKQTKNEVIQESPSPAFLPSPSPTITPTPTKSVTPTPRPTGMSLIDCVGPDGKHMKLTQKACDDFNKSWAKPTPSPTPSPQASTPVTGCAAYNPSGDLGTLTVNIQAQSGQSLVGDAGVTISRKYPECQGVDPGWPYVQVIRQGSTSVNFGGMRPGPFHIDVLYHGNTSGYEVNINSGNNSITVTVSN